MKLSNKSIAILIAIILLAGTATAKAQGTGATVDVSASASVSPSPTTKPSTPPLRDKIRAQIETRIDKNKEIRNTTLEQKKDIRMDTKAQIKDIREERHDGMMLLKASTTDMFKKNMEMRKEIAKKMEFRMFEVRKNALVRELNVAINNLTNISTRISARITKAETEGRTMTDAKALLVIADGKLATAKTQVAAFQALNIASSTPSTTASSTVQVDLAKPRVLGDAAIKAVKEAKEAYRKVIQSIAHAMGLGNTATSTKDRIGNNASSTRDRDDE